MSLQQADHVAGDMSRIEKIEQERKGLPIRTRDMNEQTNDKDKIKSKNIEKTENIETPEKTEKTQVADIDRSIYDIRNDGADDYRFDAGLSAEIVERLSREKNDPEWMREFRLRSLEIYNNMEVPDWGPDISGLDMEHIATYVRPKNNKMQNKWEDVPEEIRVSWYTTMSARRWRSRASYIWTSKVRCTRSMSP